VDTPASPTLTRCAAAVQAQGALNSIKGAVKDVLLPSINDAIKQGYKMETWSPEQFQWAEAACKVDDALTALTAIGITRPTKKEDKA
jgi:hypothetical protein